MNKYRIGTVHFCRGEWAGIVCRCWMDDGNNMVQPTPRSGKKFSIDTRGWYPIGDRKDWEKWGWEEKENENV